MSQRNIRAGTVRRKRLRQLGIAVGVVGAILSATACSSVKDTPKPNRTRPVGSRADIAALLAGVPQRGNILGDANAPLTLQYFGDLECPICKQFTLAALPRIIERWVRRGKLKIEYRSLETATRNPETFKTQQVAALAAGQQNKMWYFIELFYHEQGREDTGYVSERYLQGLAQRVPGLNLIAWTAARNDTELAGTIVSDAQVANSAGFQGTPSFVLSKPRGTLYRLRVGTFSEAAPFESAIEKLLKD